MHMSIGIHRPRKTSATVLFAIASMLLSGCNSITPSTRPTVQITQVQLHVYTVKESETPMALSELHQDLRGRARSRPRCEESLL
jgi:hypothetical protein